MKRILFLVAHPHLKKSRANRAVCDAVYDLPGLTLHRLYEDYPYFHIDVPREQNLLLEHDLIVAQHPFYWYSMPPLLKMWLDEVLTSGWAYGTGGNSLKNKQFLVSITAGAPPNAYGPEGLHRFNMDDFLKPWVQIAHLCQMSWNRPRVLHGASRSPDDILEEHAQSLRRDLKTYLESGSLP